MTNTREKNENGANQSHYKPIIFQLTVDMQHWATKMKGDLRSYVEQPS